MPKSPTIIGQIMDWQWLDNQTKVQGKLFDDEKELLSDGSNVLLEVKYKSDFINGRHPHWLVATPFTNEHERYIMYFDTELKGEL